MSLRYRLIPIALGALFGVGLTLSGMLQPAKVQDFLDVLGTWDPSLMLVMGGALVVTFLTFPRILRRSRPLLAASFALPTAQHVDSKLILGAALFGIGWGMSGFCPGPALLGLSIGSRAALIFVLAMLLGMALHRGYQVLRHPRHHS